MVPCKTRLWYSFSLTLDLSTLCPSATAPKGFLLVCLTAPVAQFGIPVHPRNPHFISL